MKILEKQKLDRLSAINKLDPHKKVIEIDNRLIITTSGLGTPKKSTLGDKLIGADGEILMPPNNGRIVKRKLSISKMKRENSFDGSGGSPNKDELKYEKIVDTIEEKNDNEKQELLEQIEMDYSNQRFVGIFIIFLYYVIF